MSPARAETINITLGDLGSALNASRSEPDAVRRLLIETIQNRLDEVDLEFNGSEFLLRDEVFNQVIEGGCNSTEILNLTTDVALASDTGISIELESLFDPIELSVRVAASVNSVGRVRQTFGFRLGDCIELGRDTFNFSAIGPLDLQLDLSITLNPEFIQDDTLRVTPVISLTGELFESNVSVDVSDSLLRGLIESFLQDEINDLFSADRLASEVADLQETLNNSFGEELTDGVLDIEIPPSDDEQILALYELLSPQARFPLTAEFLRDNRLQIIAALIFEDDDLLTGVLENAAFCEVTNVLQADLPMPASYELVNGSCVISDRSVEGTQFSDASCSQPFEYYPTTFSDFCATALNTQRLGNAQSNSFELDRWTLSPGTRFDIGALPIAGKQQPYVQRVNYKNAQSPVGNCALEMRVYSAGPTNDLNSESLRPLIAFHGGSWEARGNGFIGVENMATQFVDQGFVVFAPFYRLLSDADGSAECHNANFDELLADVDDAFLWVQQNSAFYGATGKPTLFGQSAGGHLAAYLSVQKPTEVERSVLFYAPTDFTDFGGQILRGEYTNGTGIRILRNVTGVPADQIDLQSPLVIENTFPARVALDPESFPPMFILHGESDTLLPSRQSVRMCNGLAGDVENGPAPFDTNTESVSRSFDCDNRGSQLHLIAEGEHTVDLCISDELCAAGSPASAAVTAETIDRMLLWVAADTLIPVSANDDTGGGSMGLMFIILLAGGCLRSRVGLQVFAWRRKIGR